MNVYDRSDQSVFILLGMYLGVGLRGHMVMPCWTCRGYITSLKLSFDICGMGMIMIIPLAGRMGKDWRVKWHTVPREAGPPDTLGRGRVKKG